MTMPVMPDARDVIVMTDVEGPLTVDMVYVFGNPILADNAQPATFATIASITIPAGETSSPIVPIPGNVNAFSMSSASGATQVTVVQILNT